jgi:hypothetical protein
VERADKKQWDARGLSRSVHLQDGLRRAFAELVTEPLPTEMTHLVEKLPQNDKPELKQRPKSAKDTPSATNGCTPDEEPHG